MLGLVRPVGEARRHAPRGRITMEASDFIDYYETLEISPNANSDTIERMFRYLAQRYHPDNQESADRCRFDLVLEAHGALKDPVKRAQYDLAYRRNSRARSELIQEASDSEGIERDVDIQNKILALLYVKRRKNVREPGIGDIEMERLLGCNDTYLDFHIWYLREKRWIIKGDDGRFAITIEGVERVGSEHKSETARKLLAAADVQDASPSR